MAHVPHGGGAEIRRLQIRECASRRLTDSARRRAAGRCIPAARSVLAPIRACFNLRCVRVLAALLSDLRGLETPYAGADLALGRESEEAGGELIARKGTVTPDLNGRPRRAALGWTTTRLAFHACNTGVRPFPTRSDFDNAAAFFPCKDARSGPARIATQHFGPASAPIILR